ncbi:hypothetical protein [Nocardia gamkensis]|uniref:hypothetical protein n=1 Tax=Nocardia gamkensis TaxID=352869 RepID=UPI0037C956DA
MSTYDERDDTPATVTIDDVFGALDSYLASSGEFHYDVEAGLGRLQHTIDRLAAARAQEVQRTAELREEVSAAAENIRIRMRGSTAGSRQVIVAERVRGLIVSPLRIASAITPEVAVRMADGIRGQRWVLSWLPQRVLTRQQAFSGMVLDEILTDPAELDSATMMLILAELAADLTMPLEEVLVRLSHVKKDDSYPRYRWSRCARSSGSRTVDPPILMRKAE